MRVIRLEQRCQLPEQHNKTLHQVLFNSFQFIIFFAVVFPVFYLMPGKLRPLFLLLASMYFYMSFVPAYILILLFLITTDYFLARAIGKLEHPTKRKLMFVCSLALNLSMLFFFKYFNFANENIAALAQLIGWNYGVGALKIILPLGLSFHIFQNLAYIIEVYKKRIAPEKNYIVYALYVLFFPQLVAGPIERPAHLIPQLKIPVQFEPANVTAGFQLILLGFFKKTVIADRLAVLVDRIYSNPAEFTGPIIIVALVAFTYQLYCDFSGYTDIAIGTAKVLGIDLTHNFDRPFASKSIAEFWRRWHISLSNWFRDYLYYPLIFGLKLSAHLRLYIGILITFTLMGLWHGAGWTYAIMGTIFGVYLIIGHITKEWRNWWAHMIGLDKKPKLRGAFQILVTFALVCFGWIFFRSSNIANAFDVVRSLFTGWTVINFSHLYTSFSEAAIGLRKQELLIAVAAIVVLEAIQYIGTKNIKQKFSEWRSGFRLIFYYAAIAVIIFFGYFGEKVFIYFQF